MTTIATIGVYGANLDAFLSTLRAAGVTRVVDVRQRRGVRGAEYAWANAARLQSALAGAGVEYEHRKDLAPTTELRQLQYREDDKSGVGKRSRVTLAEEYARRYVTEIVDAVDLAAFAESLPARGIAALLCVERDAEACHRSLIAARLHAAQGFAVAHLRADG